MPATNRGSGRQTSAPKRKAGRPKGSTKLQPDERTIEIISGLAKIQCTQVEAAAVLGVHVDTFSDFLRSQAKAKEAWDNGQPSGRASLRRTQFEMAKKNAAMAIWLGKQYLGQKDKSEVETSVHLHLTDAQIDDRIAVLMGKSGDVSSRPLH